MKYKNSYEYMLWIILILLISSYILINRYYPKIKTEKENQHVTEAPSPSIFLMGRYALGVKSFIEKQKLSNSQDPRIYNNLLHEMDRVIMSGTDRLCYAIILAELNGSKDALDYLKNLKKDRIKSKKIKKEISILEKLYSNKKRVDKKSYEILHSRLGWFSQVAETWGQKSDNPQRQAALASAVKTMLIIISAFTLFIFVFIISIILFFITIIKIKKNEIEFSYQKNEILDDAKKPIFLEVVISFFFILLIMQVISLYIKIPRIVILSIYFFLPFIIFWSRVRGLNMQQLCEGIGLLKGKGIIKEILSGFAGYIICIPLLILGSIITYILINITGIYPVHPIVYELQKPDTFQLVTIYALACIGAPIIEEIFFRGALYHYLRQKYSLIVSIFISGFIFAIIHPQGIIAVPAIGAIGINLALIREWRGSIIASMVAHSFNNFTVLSIAILILK